jgi:hypothetical protein
MALRALSRDVFEAPKRHARRGAWRLGSDMPLSRRGSREAWVGEPYAGLKPWRQLA